jgi:hypothetical protein
METKRLDGGAEVLVFKRRDRAACPMPQACALWLKTPAPRRRPGARPSKWDASVALLGVTRCAGTACGGQLAGRSEFSRGVLADRRALLAALVARSARPRERRRGGEAEQGSCCRATRHARCRLAAA